MDENLIKQRLVGASVLVALAVIFLPSFFQKNEKVSLDTTSQIPPAPVSETVVIPRPEKPEGIQAPPAEELFQPKIVDIPESPPKLKPSTPASEPVEVKQPVKAKVPPKKIVEKPRLNDKGVPVGWVIQAASFKVQEGAQKLTSRLLKADYQAYSQSVKTDNGVFHRVFIGPFIDEKRAQKAKLAVDKAYKIQSRVLRFNPVSGD